MKCVTQTNYLPGTEYITAARSIIETYLTESWWEFARWQGLTGNWSHQFEFYHGRVHCCTVVDCVLIVSRIWFRKAKQIVLSLAFTLQFYCFVVFFSNNILRCNNIIFLKLINKPFGSCPICIKAMFLNKFVMLRWWNYSTSFLLWARTTYNNWHTSAFRALV